MANCGRCNRRGNLIRRTASRIFKRSQPISSNPSVTAGKTCNGSVKMTPEGYVMVCDVCGTEGAPVKFPEAATIENGKCTEGN